MIKFVIFPITLTVITIIHNANIELRILLNDYKRKFYCKNAHRINMKILKLDLDFVNFILYMKFLTFIFSF